MSNDVKMTKEQILSQLEKEGVTNLDEFANFLVKKTHKNGDANGPIVMSAIIYQHGFVNH